MYDEVEKKANLKQATKAVILSVISTLCCFWPLGIVALIFSAMAQSAFKRGQVAKGRKHLKYASCINSVVFIVGFLVICALLGYFLAFNYYGYGNDVTDDGVLPEEQPIDSDSSYGYDDDQPRPDYNNEEYHKDPARHQW